MKKAISLLLIVVMLLSVCALFAVGLTSGSFTYTGSGSGSSAKATITAWSGSGDLTVPATFTDGSTTYKVTKIGSYAFANKNLTSVSFEGTNLTEIGEGAFSTNPNLSSITIPVNVTKIGARAFNSCVNLNTLKFATNCKLTTIGQFAFRNCQSLRNFTFPSSLTTIAKYAFSYCTALTSVTFPASVTSVGEEAFIGCLNLRYAIFNNQSTSYSIGDNCFDLTSTEANTRLLAISGYDGTAAKTFATAENFRFNRLTPEADPAADTSDPATPSAGDYTVKLSIRVEDNSDSDHVNGYYYRIYYKTNNGKGNETDKYVEVTKSDLSSVYTATNGTTKTVSKTVPGFPWKVYGYLDCNGTGFGWLNTNEYRAALKKITVSSTDIWTANNLTDNDSGLYLGSTKNEKNATIQWDGTGSGNDSSWGKVSNHSGAWNTAAKKPKANKIDNLTGGVSTVYLKTDGTAYRAPTAFTKGKVYDQYNVQMSVWPTLSVVDSSGNTFSDASVDSYRKLNLTATANRASNYTLTIKETSGTATNTNFKVNVKVFKYFVTYSYFEGNTAISVTREVTYNNTAAVPMAVADMPSKFENEEGHYPFSNWTKDGSTYTTSTKYTSGPQMVQIDAKYGELTPHVYTDEVTPPTCSTYGNTHSTCDCGFIMYTSYTSPLRHNNFSNPAEYTTEAIPPSDGHAGATVYKCTLCNKGYCTKKIENGVAVPDVETGTFINIQDVYEAIDGLPQKAEVPAPAFNNFAITYESGSVVGEFPYQSRLSQLKVEHQNATYVDKNTTQALRFAGAVTVPEGVSTAVGSTTITDNVVTDFGFVYTQDRYITGPSALVIGGKTDDTSVNGKTYDIAKYSVKDANTGVYNGSNWSGVTLRNMNGNNTLTFNLLIAVYAKNWNRAYAARPYLTYKYNGVEYTIYDQGTTIGATGRTYSCASVAYIATIAANNIFEPESTRTYLQNKVVNHLSEQGGYVANPTV